MAEDAAQVTRHPLRSPAPRLSPAALALIGLVRGYQFVLGPLLGGNCRFHPTCSHYALDALRAHGALRGGGLTIRRLLRCHPWAAGGIDPAPPPRPMRPSTPGQFGTQL